MPKIVYFTILSLLVFALVTVVNISGVNAREEIKFVPVSVLAEDQANYGMDGNMTIPAVSPAIIEDKVHDITPPGTVKTIRYTTLPARNLRPAGEDNDQSGLNQDNNGTDVSDQNPGNANNGNNGADNNNKDKDNTKDKSNNKDKNNKDKDSGSSSGKSDNKTNEKAGESGSSKSKSTPQK